jgi:hypothetical protein
MAALDWPCFMDGIGRQLTMGFSGPAGDLSPSLAFWLVSMAGLGLRRPVLADVPVGGYVPGWCEGGCRAGRISALVLCCCHTLVETG